MAIDVLTSVAANHGLSHKGSAWFLPHLWGGRAKSVDSSGGVRKSLSKRLMVFAAGLGVLACLSAGLIAALSWRSAETLTSFSGNFSEAAKSSSEIAGLAIDLSKVRVKILRAAADAMTRGSELSGVITKLENTPPGDTALVLTTQAHVLVSAIVGVAEELEFLGEKAAGVQLKTAAAAVLASLEKVTATSNRQGYKVYQRDAAMARAEALTKLFKQDLEGVVEGRATEISNSNRKLTDSELVKLGEFTQKALEQNARTTQLANRLTTVRARLAEVGETPTPILLEKARAFIPGEIATISEMLLAGLGDLATDDMKSDIAALSVQARALLAAEDRESKAQQGASTSSASIGGFRVVVARVLGYMTIASSGEAQRFLAMQKSLGEISKETLTAEMLVSMDSIFEARAIVGEVLAMVGRARLISVTTLAGVVEFSQQVGPVFANLKKMSPDGVFEKTKGFSEMQGYLEAAAASREQELRLESEKAAAVSKSNGLIDQFKAQISELSEAQIGRVSDASGRIAKLSVEHQKVSEVYRGDAAVELEMVEQQLIVSFGLAAIAILFAAWTLFFLSRRLAKPLSRLAAYVSVMADGGRPKFEQSTQEDEIALLIGGLKQSADAKDAAASADQIRFAEAEARTENARGLTSMVEVFLQDYESFTRELGDATSVLGGEIGQVSGVAERNFADAQAIQAGSSSASEATTTVAAAVEELVVTIESIQVEVQGAADLALSSRRHSSSVKDDVSQLMGLAQGLGVVTADIRSLARQTNLLALNATIEASRAGEAGQGFAVVASEVKMLATETESMTKKIQQDNDLIQSRVVETGQAMSMIDTAVDETSRATESIAAAIRQIGSTVTEISAAISHVAETATQSSSMAAGVLGNASETSESVARSRLAMQRVLGTLDKFSGKVSAFSEGVREIGVS